MTERKFGSIYAKEDLSLKRKRTGYNQKEFADEINKSRPWYNQAEGGKVGVSEDTATKICEELNTDFEELFEIETGVSSEKDQTHHIGTTIRKKRKERDMKLKDVSERVDISKGYLSEIERGEKDPSDETLNKIVKELFVEPREFLENQELIDEDRLYKFFDAAAKKGKLDSLKSQRQDLDEIFEKIEKCTESLYSMGVEIPKSYWEFECYLLSQYKEMTGKIEDHTDHLSEISELDPSSPMEKYLSRLSSIFVER